MRVLENLEPKNVFRFFEELTQIPRPSHQEKAVSDYLVRFAKARGLEVHQDAIYNVIIIKEASTGYENEAPIILQGHMDMVCETAPGCTKDMSREGLDLVVTGDYISAKGTTLGGDDGVAVAYALALLDDETLAHPRLEFVCTVAEEVGMDGAHAIDCSPLKGHLLLNMDSEDEGVVLAGCAGGGTAEVSLPAEREACPWERATLQVTGLTGGHSGTEINKGRSSSVAVLARVLREAADQTDLRLLAMVNGSKDNAISREGTALVAVENRQAFADAVAASAKAIAAEVHAADPGLAITVTTGRPVAGVAQDADALNAEATRRALALMTALPAGVQRMSDNVAGLVETSLNWGVATLDGDGLVMRAALRSSVGTAYRALADKVRWVAQSLGATVETGGEYPAWEWVEDSVLRDKMARIYREMFGKELVIEAIHAGVECGLLAGKIPNLDAISMGPDILDIHTPQERLSISSTKRMYDFIVKIIETK